MIVETFVAAFVVMLASLVGILATWKVFGGWVTRNLHYLISFSAGVFLIVSIGLVQEVLEVTSITNTLILIGFGVLIFFVFGRIVLGSHEHHDPSEHNHVHSKKESTRIMAADALHNITDGIILVPAFAVSIELGVVVTIGIVFHELIQEISEFFVLREAGYSTKGALLRNFLVSSTILIGIVLGVFLTRVESIEFGLLGLAAGGFFYVVFADLLPHSLERCKSRHALLSHAVAALFGVIIMLGVNTLSLISDIDDENIDVETLLASE